MLHKIFYSGLLFFFLSFFFPVLSTADQNLQKIKIPDSLNEGLNQLFNIADPDVKEPFCPENTLKILDFIMSPKINNAIYYPDQKKFRSSSAYYEFDINTTMDHLLNLAFNPNLPSFILMPAMVRYSHWIEMDSPKKLSDALVDLKEPVIIKGVEYVENTPDYISGAYYDYKLDRMLILFKIKGRNVFITLSKQKDISDVGRKGFKLGSDEDWNFIYSKRVGLTKPGLGWIRSYMYDSYTVSIYYESTTCPSRIRCGMFKWLRAGWSRINMVREKHIYKGMDRYAKNYKQILENALLPKPEEISKVFSTVQQLGLEELRVRTRQFLKELHSIYSKDKTLSKAALKELSNIDKYLQRMKSYEMRSLLMIEYLKYMIGKKTLYDKTFLSGLGIVKG